MRATNGCNVESGRFELHGARFDVRAADPDARSVVAAALPPGAIAAEPGPVDQDFSVVVADESGRGAPSVHRVFSGEELVVECADRDGLIRELASTLDFAVAEHASRRVYVHAGVVDLDGHAIVIPGRSLSGKTTLVTALVRAGATFYSDEFAVIDRDGRVWPHARPLSIRPRGTTGPGLPVPIEELGAQPGSGPVTIGTVVSTRHVAGASWRPVELDRGEGLLRMLDNAIVARTKPQLALSMVAGALSSARVLDGPRGDADETARRILDLVGQRRDVAG